MSETNLRNIYQRLLEVQHEVKAPKQPGGRFGKARSAEQVLAEAKPICYKHGLYLYTEDSIEYREGRHYIVVTAAVVNVDKPAEVHFAKAYAWEGEQDRSLDTAQVSGKTSSYAKKYALQHLLGIDDTKDADFDDTKAPAAKQAAPTAPAQREQGTPRTNDAILATNYDKSVVTRMYRELDATDDDIRNVLLTKYGIDAEHPMTKTQYRQIVNDLK